MTSHAEPERSMGLVGATSVGVGAIVGGGVLALAGVAFATTGPAALAAFALNGLIAIVTALSFAELATRFPEHGGTYAFARKVLSIEAAFTVRKVHVHSDSMLRSDIERCQHLPVLCALSERSS